MESVSIPSSRENCGAIEAVRKEAGEDSVILDIDEMGPTSAKSYPGQQAVNVNARPAERAKQEIDYGRRAFGYVYGALWETTGQCWTECYPGRCAVHFVDFLCSVDSQIPEDKEHIYAIMDNLEMHHSRDLLLFLIHIRAGSLSTNPPTGKEFKRQSKREDEEELPVQL